MMKKLLFAFAAYIGVAAPVHATLGEKMESIATVSAAMHATARVTAHASYTQHEMTSPQGITVREYTGADGLVFAVTWNGPWRPDMNQLLGAFAGSFSHSNETGAAKVTGRHPINREEGDLVLHSFGHMHRMWGSAYLKSRVPAGVDAESLR